MFHSDACQPIERKDASGINKAEQKQNFIEGPIPNVLLFVKRERAYGLE
jgi:hypothetical protein